MERTSQPKTRDGLQMPLNRNYGGWGSRFCVFAVACFVAAVAPAQFCHAQQSRDALPSFERATKRIQSATVTLRITSESPIESPLDNQPDAVAKGDDADGSNVAQTKKAIEKEVAVFSGVYIGDGKLVTPLFLHPTTGIRITLAGGEQCNGKTLLMDEYSGLSLLSIDDRTLTGLEIADDVPAVGSHVLTGAGWGVYAPLVSAGIVSGIGHHLPNSDLPPLLVCDVRTSRTSKGAPIVSTSGQLLGIVIAMTSDEDGRWTYAIPANHIQRLQRSYRENFIDAETGKEKAGVGVVVLPRRRPQVGMHLSDLDGRITVVRVEENGPAFRAGLRKNDEIVEVDGIEIRSVYQAIRPTLFKQPGDEMKFTIQNQAGETVEKTVVLGGESTFKPAALADIGDYIVPQIVFKSSAQKTFGLTLPDPSVAMNEGKSATQSQVELLQKAVEAYQSAIDFQQRQLLDSKKQTFFDEQRIRDLEQKIGELELQLKSRPEAQREAQPKSAK